MSERKCPSEDKIKELLEQGKNVREIAKEYSVSRQSLYRNINKEKERTENKIQEGFIKIIKQKKLTTDEIRKVINGFNKPDYERHKIVKIDFPEESVRFLAFGDCHMGHKEYRPDVMEKMILDAERSGCEFAVNCGDTLEGMSGREGHIYELDKIGATEQIEYFCEQFKKFKPDFNIYSIEASQSHSGWFGSKGNMGLDIGKTLEEKSKKYKFLGYDEQDLVLENGLKIRLKHPGGGTAYAISYHMQKYIESISGGQKPNLLFQGHFHKAEYLFYRNIHGYDVGCLMNQSIFMKKTNTPAHIGYWIVDVKLNKDKEKIVERVTNTFVPFFE
jgi:predicted DNA-binding protein YlxM (UPF0122 family)